MSYAEKLKDPRWQKKRLEVLNLYEFACGICGDETTELHVHHVGYLKGKEPWDYPLEMLKCLCKPCHENITKVDIAFNGLSQNEDISFSVGRIKSALSECAGMKPGDESLCASFDFIACCAHLLEPPSLAEYDLHLLPIPDAVEVLKKAIKAGLEGLKK